MRVGRGCEWGGWGGCAAGESVKVVSGESGEVVRG